MLDRIYDLLSSMKLAVVLTITGAVYEIMLTAWAATSSVDKVARIGKMSPFVLLWALLLLNTLLCMARRFPSYAKGGRAGAGSLLLHAAVLLVAASMLLSGLFRFEGKFQMGVREKIKVTRSDYEKVESSGLADVEPPPFEIDARTIETKFWGDELLFTRFASVVRLNGKEKEIAINDPAFLSPFTSIRLTSFGYGLSYMVTVDGVNVPVEEKAVKLNIFPPGTEGTFVLDSFPHRFYVSLYPDYAEKDGRPSSKSMRLEDPRFKIGFYRGKVFLGTALVKPGEVTKIEQFGITFLGALPTAEYAVVYDPGFPLLVFSFLVGLAGFWCRMTGRKGGAA